MNLAFSLVPLFLVAAWGALLWATHGIYTETLIALFPILLLVPFVRWPSSERAKAFLRNGEPWVAILFFAATTLSYPLIYPAVDLAPLRWASGVAIVLSVGALAIRRVRNWLLIAAALVQAIALFLVIRSSPSPYIDVWSYLQIASDALAVGLNPYDMAYPQMYKAVEGHFPYPPLTLYLLAPFRWLFSDVRYGLWLATLGSAVLLGALAKQARGRDAAIGVALLFLAFPIMPFVLEQSWTDPLSLLFLFASLLAFQREKRVAGLLLLGAFVGLKQYNVIPAAFILVSLTSWRSLLRDLALLVVIPILSMIPHLALDARSLVDRLTHVPTMDQPFFFSLSTWLRVRGMAISNVVAIGSAGALGLAWLWKRRHATKDLEEAIVASFVFTWMLLWFTTTTCNYLWFGIFGIWVWLALGRTSLPKFVSMDWAVFWITRLLLVFAVPAILSDVPLYYFYAQEIVQNGKQPFVQLPIEYPPGSLLLILPPWFLDVFSAPKNHYSYRFLFQLLLLATETSFFSWWRKRWGVEGQAVWLYLVFTTLLFPFVYDRLDLPIGCLIAFAAFAKFPDRTSWKSLVATSLGTLTKFVAALLTPLFVLRDWSRHRSLVQNLVRGVLVSSICGGPLVVATAWIAWQHPSSEVTYFAHHAKRGIQIESIYGSAALGFSQLIGGPAAIEHGFGSYNVKGVDWLVSYSVYGFLLALAAAYSWIFFRWARGRQVPWTLSVWIVFLAFVTFNRVLSPQFLAWLAPIGALMGASLEKRRRAVWIAAFTFVGAATTYVFLNYVRLVQLDPVLLAIVNARNAILVLLLPVSILWFEKDRS